MIDGKGYVEMTSIDAETSQDIATSIIQKGGRYLEAQVFIYSLQFFGSFFQRFFRNRFYNNYQYLLFTRIIFFLFL